MNPRDLVAPIADDILATADEIETRKSLPEALMAKLMEAGLFSIYTPRQFGGLDLPLPAALRVVEEVSKLDGSTGWTVALGIHNALFTSVLSEQVAARVLPHGSALIAGAPGFSVRADPVDGGYRLSGQWSFNSGAPNATWTTVAAPIFNGDGPRMGPSGPEMVVAFIPPTDVEIVEGTWNVRGMCGTGSYDLRVDSVFVPQDMTGSLGLPAGLQPVRESPVTRIPFTTIFLVAQSPTVCLGIARHAIDEFKQLALRKESAFGGPKLFERPQAHIGLARAEALLRSARSYWFETIEQLWDSVTASREVTSEERVAVRLAGLTATENSVAAVDTVYRLAGSTAILASSPLDRCWRDVHVAGQHFQVQEGRWETSGRVLFGLEPNDLFV